MAYEVTATRKRPFTFDSLVGQEFVVSTLHNAITSGRIAHAYLFAGPRGVGKTSAARILARCLNNPAGPSANAFEDNSAADDIARGRSIDVIEIDGASNTSVNDVRTIKDEVLFPPQYSRYKIYIIDEVHMLSNSAFNALLKTIEEPPPYVIFIFATTEIHKVPATIRSRCQQFNFRLIPLETVKQKLSEACGDLGIKADDEALFWIAKEGTGSLRDSYTLFDQVASFSADHITLEKIREKLGFVGLEQLNVLASHALAASAKDALEALDEILQAGISVEQCIVDIADYYRGVLLVQTGIRREALLGSSAERYLPEAVKTYTRGQLERIVATFLNLYRDVRYSLDPRCELELAVVRLSRMRFCMDPQELYERLEEIERRYIHSSHSDRIEAANQPTPAAILKTAVSVPSANPVVIPQSKENTPPTVTQPIVTPTTADTPTRFKMLFAKERPMLAGILDSMDSCRIEADIMIISFESAFAANRARDESAVLLASARQIWPQLNSIDVAVNNKTPDISVSPQVSNDPALDLVKEVFRAEIVNKGDEQ